MVGVLVGFDVAIKGIFDALKNDVSALRTMGSDLPDFS